MLVYQGNFDRAGPLIPLMVYNPDTGNGLAVFGLLDTGADGLCVSCRVVEHLGLASMRREPMNTATGPVERVPVVQATFELQDTATFRVRRFEKMRAAVAALGSAHGMRFDVVLGWPVVSRGKLITEVERFTFSIAPDKPDSL